MTISTPHTATLIRPAATRNAGTNEEELNYKTPAMTNPAFKCMFQTRNGRVVQLPGGLIYQVEGELYSLSADVQLNDVIVLTAAQVGFDAKYIVVGVAPKCGMDGCYSHTQSTLTRYVA